MNLHYNTTAVVGGWWLVVGGSQDLHTSADYRIFAPL
jgi:hypothetical protein